MNVLVACESSGVVRDAFMQKGHNAWSCDTQPADDGGLFHYCCDVRDVLYAQDWDLIIAHPPCTFMCNSGVCHLHKDESRWGKLDAAADFFNIFLDHPCPKICIENPVPHKYAVLRLKGRKYTQTIQPWQFGHPESKRTCFWLKGLPKLKESNNVKHIFDKLPKNKQQRIHFLPPGPDRWKLRSKTFQGIADAMADQWG